MNDNEKKIIADALLKDYDNIRAEIRIALNVQERTCTWLTVGIVVAFSYCFKEGYEISYLFFPTIVLGHLSLLLNRHSLMIAVLMRWIQRIEKCFNNLLEWEDLFDWESTFVRKLYESYSINFLGLKELKPQTLFNLIIILPSISIFFISVVLGAEQLYNYAAKINIPKVIAYIVFIGLNILLFSIVIAGYISLVKKNQYLDKEKEKSINKFIEISNKKLSVT